MNTFSTTIALGDEIGELQPHDRQDRRQRVGQGVSPRARRGAKAPLARAVRMKSSFRTSSSADRVTRVRIAACTSAKRERRQDQRAERPHGSSPSRESRPTGRCRQCTAKISTSRIANQKLGTARPTWLAAITAASPVRPRRCAGENAGDKRRAAATAIASSASGALTASARAINGAIGES